MFFSARMFSRAAAIGIMLCSAAFGKDYMSISKNDWTLGALKLDINANNGAFSSMFGVLVDEGTIITSAAILDSGYPVDINIKMQDEMSDLIICVAKARMVVNDGSLAMLKITHYTDDYCHFSEQKLYHHEMIKNQQISHLRVNLDRESPFLLSNKNKTILLEQGFPYFDKNGEFVGISSNARVISRDAIMKFFARYK